jgi:hypothetical protein
MPSCPVSALREAHHRLRALARLDAAPPALCYAAARRRTVMKRAGVCVAIFLVLSVTMLPGPASAGGGWHGGHRGGHGGWFWPGALIGGIVAGAVTLATAPLWAFTPPPQPVVVQTPPPAVYAAPAVYVAPPVYAVRALPVPPPDSAPPPRPSPQPAAYVAPASAPAVNREVVYDNGRYVLYGDGVRQPWQWVWVPAAAPPPPPPAPPR